MNSSSIPKEVDKLVCSLLVVLVESIVDGENDSGFSPGLDEFSSNAGIIGIENVTVSKEEVVVEATEAVKSSSCPSFLVVLVESIADDENTTGFFPGLELDGDAVSKLDVFIEAVDAEISTSFPKDVDEIV